MFANRVRIKHFLGSPKFLSTRIILMHKFNDLKRWILLLLMNFDCTKISRAVNFVNGKAHKVLDAHQGQG